MKKRRGHPAWLLLGGTVALWAVPFAVVQVLDSLESGMVEDWATAIAIAALAPGLALLIAGTLRARARSKPVTIAIAVADLLLAGQYLAWVREIVDISIAAIGFWIWLLIPFATFALVALVANTVRREQAAWSAAGFVLWIGLATGVWYLFYIVSGI